MTDLRIDIETYSSVDLKEMNVYKYVEAPDFEIQLFGFAFDSDAATVVDLANGERLPRDVVKALDDLSVPKRAWNAPFERICIGAYLGLARDPEHWYCTMARAIQLGLPASLDMAGKVLGIPTQKDKEGKALVTFFSKPCKPTKKNGGLTRNLTEANPVKWDAYKEYNRRDVEAEGGVLSAIRHFKLPKKERRIWVLDQQINDRGIRVDKVLVHNAIEISARVLSMMDQEARDLTGIDNPNSVEQIKDWLLDHEGLIVTSLNKDNIGDYIDKCKSPEAKRLLEIRSEMNKASVKKFIPLQRATCQDGRIHGLLRYYGASTGRWSGNLFQPQNLPRPTFHDIDLERDLIKSKEYELTQMLYGSIQTVLSDLVRPALIAEEGKRLFVGDFSAIEARVIAWLANEEWKLEVFATHGKIYEATASRMFHVDIDKVGKDLRQRAKTAELALGYAGGENALIAGGALEKGLKREDLADIVKAWRRANPNIVKLWRTLENAALAAVRDHQFVSIAHGIQFGVENDILFVRLPSGRRLAYPKPRLGVNRFGSQSVEYESYRKKSVIKIGLYSGLIAENVTQAVARDCLAEKMLEVDAAGFPICLHVHDEIVAEDDETRGSDEMLDVMRQPISWAPGLPLNAAGFVSGFYMKD